jgi:hypothetical protein
MGSPATLARVKIHHDFNADKADAVLMLLANSIWRHKVKVLYNQKSNPTLYIYA